MCETRKAPTISSLALSIGNLSTSPYDLKYEVPLNRFFGLLSCLFGSLSCFSVCCGVFRFAVVFFGLL